MPDYRLGWAIEHENFAALADNAVMFTSAVVRGDIPHEVDPRGTMREYGYPKNQGSQGACQGFSLCCAGECAHFIATGGKYQRFSEDAAYYGTQRIDNISGDKGSTIWGGVQLAKEKGYLPYELFPYSPQYNPPRNVPDSWYKTAAAFKLYHHVEIRSMDDCLQFLGQGIGSLHTGITWPNSFSNVGKDGVLTKISGRGGGGHATAWCGYVQKGGEPHLILANSWGSGWGDQGFGYLSPRVVDQLCQDRNTAIYGLSDMAEMTRRDLPWDYLDDEGGLI